MVPLSQTVSEDSNIAESGAKQQKSNQNQISS